MRTMAIVTFALAACGSGMERSDGPDASTPSGADGAVIDGGVVDAPGDATAPGDAAALTACEQATLHSDFAWIETHVLVPSCATAGCHSGANPEVGLRLDAGAAYANLVDKGSSTQPGWIRVVPGSVATSYLAVALGRADGPPPRDGFMPLGADPLCGEMLDAVERWIRDGAMP